MAWIVVPSAPFRQQKTGIRATRIDGLKSPGCSWIPAAFGRQRKAENQTFSTTCIPAWKTLEQSLDCFVATRLAMTRIGTPRASFCAMTRRLPASATTKQTPTEMRTCEMRLATPEQFDLERGLWIIPPENVKQLQRKLRKTEDVPPYIVPLSRQAAGVVRNLFRVMTPSQRYLLRNRADPGRGVSESVLNAALKRMSYCNRLTVHGFRATFSTAFNEIGYPVAWIEAQLSHSYPNAIRAAYNHAEYVEQRRRMMQNWADRLDLLEQGKIEEASRHLVVHLESVPRLAALEQPFAQVA
jgi:hypothetical protein